MDGNNNNVMNQEPVINPEPAFEQPAFEQPVYNQPAFDQGFAQGGFDPNYAQPSDLQGFNREKVKCPGKEIISFVFGINSLAWGALGLLFSWIPIYGIIFSFIWGVIFGVGCGIVAIVMHKKVHEEAEEFTGKAETGKKLAIPGIILGIVGFVVSILVIIVFVAIVGVGAVSSLSSYSNYTP